MLLRPCFVQIGWLEVCSAVLHLPRHGSSRFRGDQSWVCHIRYTVGVPKIESVGAISRFCRSTVKLNTDRKAMTPAEPCPCAGTSTHGTIRRSSARPYTIMSSFCRLPKSASVLTVVCFNNNLLRWPCNHVMFSRGKCLIMSFTTLSSRPLTLFSYCRTKSTEVPATLLWAEDCRTSSFKYHAMLCYCSSTVSSVSKKTSLQCLSSSSFQSSQFLEESALEIQLLQRHYFHVSAARHQTTCHHVLLALGRTAKHPSLNSFAASVSTFFGGCLAPLPLSTYVLWRVSFAASLSPCAPGPDNPGSVHPLSAQPSFVLDFRWIISRPPLHPCIPFCLGLLLLLQLRRTQGKWSHVRHDLYLVRTNVEQDTALDPSTSSSFDAADPWRATLSLCSAPHDNVDTVPAIKFLHDPVPLLKPHSVSLSPLLAPLATQFVDDHPEPKMNDCTPLRLPWFLYVAVAVRILVNRARTIRLCSAIGSPVPSLPTWSQMQIV